MKRMECAAATNLDVVVFLELEDFLYMLGAIVSAGQVEKVLLVSFLQAAFVGFAKDSVEEALRLSIGDRRHYAQSEQT